MHVPILKMIKQHKTLQFEQSLHNSSLLPTLPGTSQIDSSFTLLSEYSLILCEFILNISLINKCRKLTGRPQLRAESMGKYIGNVNKQKIKY